MNGAEALRAVEARVAQQRSHAVADAAFYDYQRATLPRDAHDDPKIRQGWDAGYAAAMRAVFRVLDEEQRSLLTEMTTARHDSRGMSASTE